VGPGGTASGAPGARAVFPGCPPASTETALARARAGNGQVIGVVAEAGTGKSRLCYEFAEHCRAAGMRVIEGRCAAHGRNVPLLPILQIFRHYYGITEQDSDRSAREKLAGHLLLLDDAYREVLPVLFEFFGVPDPDRPVPHIDPDLKQRQLFGVLRKLVQRGAEDTVALIEDLHWIDGASAAWLEQWVDAIAGTRFVLIVNFRPEFEATWVRKSYYQQLALAPISTQAVHQLLASLLGPDPSIAGLADAIHARTGGNPFFTEEVVQALIESGKLHGSAGEYRLTAPVETLDVPASVQAVLAARIDRLSGPEKLVLQEAASSDLNSAIEAATRHVMVQNAGGFLMLPADVPEVTIAVLRQTLVALDQNGSVVLAPAISDGGTNLLACRPPHAIRPEFGTGSFAKHLAAAERSGLACHVLNSPELGRDIDSPEDLARFLDRRTSTSTDRLLRDLGVAARRVSPGLATAYETQLLSGGNLSEERREYIR
jgi:2-phospho-L-lactate guanylyltransferase